MSTSASAQRPLRCGLVGLTFIASAPAVPTITGGRGILPYSHASALARIPHLIELVAICDIVPTMIDRFQAEWGSTWPELHTYLDVNAMIEQEHLDLLAVVTPDNRHATIVVAAAQAGIPAIMCEKPLATTLADADRMIGAIEANGTLMTVEHTRRWDPYFHQVKALIEAGKLGQIRTITGTLHGERAMLFRNGTHIIDLMNYYAGAEPVSVFARLEPGYEDFVAYRGDGGHDPASEPGATAYIEYANGIRGIYNGEKGTFGLTEWDILGTEGRIRINAGFADYWTREAATGELVQRPFPATLLMTGAIQAAYEELVAALQSGGTIRSTARDARQTLGVIEAILRSNQTGQLEAVNREVATGQGAPA
ncbi:MAG: Gfo/Idh/MocA family oxidoreductase [Thermomicrobiales bacterium]